MDIAVLSLEYCNLFIFEEAVKGVIYSIKLKLEFAILGKLVQLVHSGNNVIATLDTAEFVDATPITSDSTHMSTFPR